MSIDVDALRTTREPVPDLDIEIADRTYRVKQLGTAAVYRFYAGRSHPSGIVRYFTVRRFLRAAFGWHWRRDPVSQLMDRPAEVRGRVIAALLHQAGAATLENAIDGE